MRYLIKTSGKQGLTEADFAAMMAALPAQNANDEKRIELGIQEGPALVAADRSAGWRVFQGESQDQVLEILKAEPLYEFCVYDFTPLLEEEDNVPRP